MKKSFLSIKNIFIALLCINLLYIPLVFLVLTKYQLIIIIFIIINSFLVLGIITFLIKSEMFEIISAINLFLKDNDYSSKELAGLSSYDLIKEFVKYCTRNLNVSEITKDNLTSSSYSNSLHLTEERRKSLFEYAAYPILVMDVNKNIVDVNSSFCELVNYDESALESFQVDIVFPDNQLINMILEVMDKQRYWSGNSDLLTSDGEFVPVKLNINKVYSGEVKLIQVFVEDLRELKRREREIERQTSQIKKFDELIVNRELKMIDLKKENNKLQQRIKSLQE